jgi:hypothetical protein
MLLRIQSPRDHGAYRLSSTATLSDVPLLIGEILRRSDLRFQKRARRQARIRKIKEIFAMQ